MLVFVGHSNSYWHSACEVQCRSGEFISCCNVCGRESVLIIVFVCVEGPRVGWILVAQHPIAVATHPLPAFQRDHSHTATGERCPHSPCLNDTHSGWCTSTVFLIKLTFASQWQNCNGFYLTLTEQSRLFLALWRCGTWWGTPTASFISVSWTKRWCPDGPATSATHEDSLVRTRATFCICCTIVSQNRKILM